ncbi:MAG: hypothetical protein V1846_01105 [Candidatus Komeilibacteria bacterium]
MNNDFPVTAGIPRRVAEYNSTNWLAFWLSVGFTVIASLVVMLMILGRGSIWQTPGSFIFYGLLVGIPAFVLAAPLGYIFARNISTREKHRQMLKLLGVVIIIFIVVGISLSAQGIMASGGGWGLAGFILMGGTVAAVFLVKLIGLSILLHVPEVIRKRIQFVIVLFVAVIFILQLFGLFRLAIFD